MSIDNPQKATSMVSELLSIRREKAFKCPKNVVINIPTYMLFDVSSQKSHLNIVFDKSQNSLGSIVTGSIT